MDPYLRLLRFGIALLVPVLAVVSVLSSPGQSHADTTAVSVFPISGSKLANPRTQITFRGLPVSQWGPITVTGSRSGVHSGNRVADSDGRGGSFIPAKPFTPGEVVTVTTKLNIVGGRAGVFRFTVSSPAGRISFLPFKPAARTRGDVWNFHSYPQIHPVAMRVTRQSSHTAHGYIFLTPWFGPVQNGVMILDSRADPVWFKTVPKYRMASDFREQTYQGKPVLTWWQGYFGSGVGSGLDVIYNTAYQQIATVHAGNGLTADLHGFNITPQNTALIFAEYPVNYDASSIHKTKHAVVFDTVVQEIDIPTGLVLFQWDSLDHVPLSRSYTKFPKTRRPFDYFHGNAIQQDADGNLIVSARSTSAIYKIDHSTGHVIWALGGKHSSFKIGSGASPAFQHDARIRGGRDALMTVFDNGAGLFNAHSQSRALWLRLDQTHKTARELGELDHSPSLLAHFAGSVQALSNGDAFVGWGQGPYISEFSSRRHQIFDAVFKGKNASYRAFRFRFNGYPHTQPRVAAANRHHQTIVWVSWNGDTLTHRWRVLSGPNPGSLTYAGQSPRKNFETWVYVRRTSYVQVQALDSKGHVLSSSPVVRVR